MNDIDEKIREALKGEANTDEIFAEPSLVAEGIAPFRGKRKWVNVVGLMYGLIGFSLAVWGGFEFFHAEVVREQMLWGGLCFLGLMLNAFLKVFFWLEMHTNRVLREVKRVELLVLQSKQSD